MSRRPVRFKTGSENNFEKWKSKIAQVTKIENSFAIYITVQKYFHKGIPRKHFTGLSLRKLELFLQQYENVKTMEMITFSKRTLFR